MTKNQDEDPVFEGDSRMSILEYQQSVTMNNPTNTNFNSTIQSRTKKDNSCLRLKEREESRGDLGVKRDCHEARNGGVFFYLSCWGINILLVAQKMLCVFRAMAAVTTHCVDVEVANAVMFYDKAEEESTEQNLEARQWITCTDSKQKREKQN